METRTLLDKPLPLSKAARILRVPAVWLRNEVDSGRLPGLRCDGIILIHVPTVSRLLAERAQQVNGKAVQHG